MGLIRSFRGLIIPTSFNIIPSSISVKMGTTYEIPYILSPENTTNQKINWSSSDTSIATVSNGIITPVATGTATITGTTDYLGFTDTVSVEVYVVPVTGVSLNESNITLDAGETFQLEATITPSDAGEQGITWSSSNTSVATVSQNGLVTYVGDGECTITVTTVDGGYTATCGVLASSAQEFIYNFDDGTWTNDKLTADGWTNEQYGLNASSEGLVFANTSTDRGGVRKKQITGLSGYNKVTVYFKGVKNASWGGAFGGLLSESGGNFSQFITIRSNYYSPQANGAVINNNWAHQKGFSYSVEGTVIVDFANGTWTSNIDGSTSSGTISGFTLPDTLYLYCELSKGYYGTPSAIYKLHVTFE